MANNKEILLYGSALAVLLFLMKWLEWRFIIINHTFEVYAGLIALIFTLVGIWLALKLTRPKIEKVIVEKRIYADKSPDFKLNQAESDRFQLSKRELEVLLLMAEGLSNQEIAGHLFISLNTVKTHSSRLFEKLEVARRTQAVDKAKKLNLIP
jgi:NarL family two-component system response regulator LiaR